jgi:hypothetical protein
MTAFFLKNINEEVPVKPRPVDDDADVVYVTVVLAAVVYAAVVRGGVAHNYSVVVHANLLILLLLM